MKLGIILLLSLLLLKIGVIAALGKMILMYFQGLNAALYRMKSYYVSPIHHKNTSVLIVLAISIELMTSICITLIITSML